MLAGGVLLFVMYAAIPYVLWKADAALKPKGLRIPAVRSKIAFIFSCGVVHLVQVMNLWLAWYKLEAFCLLASALVSSAALVHIIATYSIFIKEIAERNDYLTEIVKLLRR